MTIVHFSFQLMVGLGLALGLCALLYWLLAARRRAPSTNRWLLLALVVAGPASVVAMETGWFVTEFGRQPWIIYGVMRTSAAATTTPALGPTFAVFVLVFGFGIARSFALSAARSLPGDIVRPENLPWLTIRTTGTLQMGMVLGPVIGGLAYAIDPVYLLLNELSTDLSHC